METSFLAHRFPGYVLLGESVDPILHDVNNDGYFRAALFSIKKKKKKRERDDLFSSLFVLDQTFAFEAFCQVM